MTNPYVKQFHEDLRGRYPIDGADVSYAQWLEKNTKMAGKPFGYTGYEFQRAIVDDMSASLSVIKPSQVGLTEVQVRKFLAILARNRGTSGIFTFPNERMFKKNSKTRIRPVVSQRCFNSSGLDDDKPQRSMDLYEINGSWAHIMGMTEGDATSTPADFLFHDEIDLSDQTMVGLYQSRLQDSSYRITQAFSTPTFPGYGIDGRFQASNQFHDMVRCRCRHWQAPKFQMPFLFLPGYTGDGRLEELDADGVARIQLSDCYVKCERCSQALDLRDPTRREWVPKYPARQAAGYKVSPFSPTHGRINIPYIFQQLLTMKGLDQIKGWHNTVLGETYSDGNSKLEPDMVRAVMKDPASPEISRTTPIALGLDMGRTCHLTLGLINRAGVDPIHFEQIPSSQIHERIAELDAQYNIVCGSVDRHPYTPDAERLRDATQGRIVPTEYRGTSFNQKDDEYGNLDYFQVNRTAVIDAQIKAVRNKATEFRGYGGLKDVIVEHLCDMVRIEADEKPATWEKLTGNDHFLHSLTLMRASIKIREIIALNSPIEPRMLMGLIGAGTNKPQPGLGVPTKGKQIQRVLF